MMNDKELAKFYEDALATARKGWDDCSVALDKAQTDRKAFIGISRELREELLSTKKKLEDETKRAEDAYKCGYDTNIHERDDLQSALLETYNSYIDSSKYSLSGKTLDTINLVKAKSELKTESENNSASA